MEWIWLPEAWLALLSLTALEIVLGIDNIVFISILVGRLPRERRQRARILGLGLAMLTRIALLLSLVWVMTLTRPLFTLFGEAISGRNLILLGGGLFLLGKATLELHHSVEGTEESAETSAAGALAGFGAVLVQIAVIDIVFSLDSVITAVGMARHLPVMILAIVIAVGIMMVAAKPISDVIERHPSLKLLALSFLLLVGFTLMAEGIGMEIPKGYIYFAMAFSLGVELLNIRRASATTTPVKLRPSALPAPAPGTNEP